jgi:hypothetical protein
MLILLLATPAYAADNGPRPPPLTEDQCAKLWSGYWRAESGIEELNGCLSWSCNLARGQAIAIQDKIKDVWDQGGCAKYRRSEAPLEVTR